MNAALGYGMFGGFGLLGAAFLFKGRSVRDWLVRIYHNERITRHLWMPGYVLSMRLVGAGWLALSIYVAWGTISSRISN